MNDNTLESGKNALEQLRDNLFNFDSFIMLIVCVGVAVILGHIIAGILRRIVNIIGAQADKSQDLRTVNRLRRYETHLVLSIALIRTGLVLFSLYFWWLIDHPTGQPTALIGASAVLVVLTGASLGPILRDIASGTVMMTEQWYGVGDHVRIEPFMDMQGVVERVTLRSTRIRGLNGEIIWVNNQQIAGVRVAPKGIRTIALELFVNNAEAGEKLVVAANRRLPTGPLLLVSPLEVVEIAEVGEKLWHITAVAETAPGREWLIEQSAVDLIKALDEERSKSVIEHGPLARYADTEADKRFRRTIANARKQPKAKRKVVKKVPIKPRSRKKIQ
ncbi:MAG TPA: mechanosensitive ion channel family protein [Candidatus Saccharimonadales bacterium]